MKQFRKLPVAASARKILSKNKNAKRDAVKLRLKSSEVGPKILNYKKKILIARMTSSTSHLNLTGSYQEEN